MQKKEATPKYHGKPCTSLLSDGSECGNTERRLSNSSCTNEHQHDARKLTRKRYNASAKGKATNAKYRASDRRRAADAKYAASEKGQIKCVKHNANYYAKHRNPNAVVPLTVEEQATIQSYYQLARRLTRLTGIRHEVDHDIPLSRSGIHHPRNLAVMAACDNRRKSDQTIAECKAVGFNIRVYHPRKVRQLRQDAHV